MVATAPRYISVLPQGSPWAKYNFSGYTITAARLIASTPGMIKEISPETFAVRSQSREECSYTVNTAAKTCTCPAHRSRPNVPCKHRLAVLFVHARGLEEQITRTRKYINTAEKSAAAFMEAARDSQEEARRYAVEGDNHWAEACAENAAHWTATAARYTAQADALSAELATLEKRYNLIDQLAASVRDLQPQEN